MPNSSGSAGCVSFGNNGQNQCSDLQCPEVHVETCANPCMMTTQEFSVPKSCCNAQCCSASCCNAPCCNAPCCSAPYCSIPAPQPMCAPQPPLYSTTTCYSASCPKCPGPPPSPPPRPMQQMNPGCCCPYQYPPQMAQPAPSYCVQSVVVGGKSDPKKDEDKCKEDEEGKGKGKPEDDVGKGGGKPERGTGTHETGPHRTGGRGPGAGLYIDPVRIAAGGLGGLFANGAGLRLPGVGLGRDEDPSKRYENYLEKILDVMKEKVEPESVGPSPIMVMQDCCSPRVKVRKIRRRRKQRKYMIESSEAPDDEIVEEEEGSPCSYVYAAPRLRRCRHFF